MEFYEKLGGIIIKLVILFFLLAAIFVYHQRVRSDG